MRCKLYDIAQSLVVDSRGGRQVTMANLHMTLHFIGNVGCSKMACLRRQASRVTASPFELWVDCYGYFDKPRVLWIGCRVLPSALLELQEQLGRFLRGCDFVPESRDYNPHLTIARKVSPFAEGTVEPVRWSVDRFVLIESHTTSGGVYYNPVAEYFLR